MENISITVLGLGKMGGQIAKRLHKNGLTVYGWNMTDGPINEFNTFGIFSSIDLEEITKKIDSVNRVCWIMIPQAAVDNFIENSLSKFLKKGDIVIDGGNSFYKDSMRRAQLLKEKD